MAAQNGARYRAMENPFERLPDDIMANILERSIISAIIEDRAGDMKCSMAKLASVCKRFRASLKVARVLAWSLFRQGGMSHLARYLLQNPLEELRAVSLDFGPTWVQQEVQHMLFEPCAPFIALLVLKHKLRQLRLDDVHLRAADEDTDEAGGAASALMEILRACPELEYLGLSILWQGPDYEDSMLDGRFCGLSFTRLKVLHLRCAVLVLEGFDTLFPVLEELKFDGDLQGMSLTSFSLRTFD